MIDIILKIHIIKKNWIFLETDTMIPLDSRERKKICNLVKKSYGLSNLKMLDEFGDSSEVYIPLDD